MDFLAIAFSGACMRRAGPARAHEAIKVINVCLRYLERLRARLNMPFCLPCVCACLCAYSSVYV